MAPLLRQRGRDAKRSESVGAAFGSALRNSAVCHPRYRLPADSSPCMLSARYEFPAHLLMSSRSFPLLPPSFLWAICCSSLPPGLLRRFSVLCSGLLLCSHAYAAAMSSHRGLMPPRLAGGKRCSCCRYRTVAILPRNGRLGGVPICRPARPDFGIENGVASKL